MKAIAWVLAGMLALSFAPTGNAANAAEAADYRYPFSFTDPEGDQAGPVPVVGAGGEAVPETDIVGFEMTDDGEEWILRFLMGTLEFEQGTVNVHMQATGPGGEDWEASVTYGPGGADSAMADFDPNGDDGPTGDPDDIPPGARAEVSTDQMAIYVFVPFGEAGLALGDTILVDDVSSSRGFSAGGLSGALNGGDSVPEPVGGTYTLQAGAIEEEDEGQEGEGPTDPRVHYHDAHGEAVHATFTSASDDTHRHNVTVPYEAVNATWDATVQEGSVRLTIRDGGGATVHTATLDSSSAGMEALDDVEAGTWLVILDGDGFLGSVDVTLQERIEPAPPEETPPEETPPPENENNPPPEDDDAPSPETDEESPAIGSIVLVAMLGLLALARRR